MTYNKTGIPYNKMSVEQLKDEKRKHFENPEYFLKLMKPPIYYTIHALLDGMIKKAEKHKNNQ
jgi:hypothetical protein